MLAAICTYLPTVQRAYSDENVTYRGEEKTRERGERNSTREGEKTTERETARARQREREKQRPTAAVARIIATRLAICF